VLQFVEELPIDLLNGMAVYEDHKKEREGGRGREGEGGGDRTVIRIFLSPEVLSRTFSNRRKRE